MQRLDEPEKNWKFSAADVKEREHWNDYQTAYEELIQHTATKHAPWYVVPADNKWFTRLVVSQAIVDVLKSFKLKYPAVTGPAKTALAEARRELENE
jgi:polyphosphate kinase 2 (PPK2 family)